MMSNRQFWVRHRQEWTSAIACVSVFLAPMLGCGGTIDLGDLDDLDLGNLGGSANTGLFIEEGGTTSGLLGAAKNAQGDTFFVFGVRASDGQLQEVNSILVEESDGAESFVTFESGRPVHAQGPAGSYAHAVYTSVTSTSLAGTATVKNAETGQTQELDFSVDLQRGLDDLSQQIEDATGQSLNFSSVVDGSTIETGKAMQRGLRITILPLYGLFVIPMVAAMGLMMIIFSQLMIAMFVVIAKTLVVAIFRPMFVIGSLLGDVLLRIRIVPLLTIFSVLPPRPTVIIT